jgi:transcriptional regulator with XRE-family HTH domain
MALTGFGQRVREYRLSLGMTQEQFAASLGLVKQTVANAESGQRGFSLEILKLLRDRGVDLNWLVAGDPPIPPQSGSP